MNRAEVASALIADEAPAAEVPPGKVLVEHSSINPNKAAHIGHLRNAILGDTFVRMLRFAGREVDVQNYIDNTGAQVADVVVGFLNIEKKSRAEIQLLAAAPRFDYVCWDLYARVSQWYEEDKTNLQLRSATLHAIEEGNNETAAIADLISVAIWKRWSGSTLNMTFCHGRAKFCTCTFGMRHLQSSRNPACSLSRTKARIKAVG